MRVLIAVLTSTLLVAAMAMAAAQDKGAETVVLDGGSRGNITFPHRLHQDNLGDCQACHEAFPMEKGSIVKLKTQGQLKNKQVMNAQCVACHKQYKADGKKYGPVKCGECHIK